MLVSTGEQVSTALLSHGTAQARGLRGPTTASRSRILTDTLTTKPGFSTIDGHRLRAELDQRRVSGCGWVSRCRSRRAT